MHHFAKYCEHASYGFDFFCCQFSKILALFKPELYLIKNIFIFIDFAVLNSRYFSVKFIFHKMQDCRSKKNQKIATCRQLFNCAAHIPRLLKITDYFFARLPEFQIFSPDWKVCFFGKKKNLFLLLYNVGIRRVRDKSANIFKL